MTTEPPAAWFSPPDLGVGVKHGTLQLRLDSKSGRLEWISSVKSGYKERLGFSEATTIFPAVNVWNGVRLSTDIEKTYKRSRWWRQTKAPSRITQIAKTYGEEALPSVVEPWQVGSCLASPASNSSDGQLLLFPIGDFQRQLGAACIRHSQGIVQCEACADPLLELDQSILQIETSSLSQSPLVAIRESHKIHLLDLVNDGGNNRPLYLGNVRASKLRQLHPNSSVIDMSWLGNGSNELVYVDIDGCVMICNIAIEATKAVKRKTKNADDEQADSSEPKESFARIAPSSSGALAVASNRILSLLDPRSSKRSETELYSVSHAKGMPARIVDVLKHPMRDAHRQVLVTSNAVVYLDDRMPNHPLLNWRHYRHDPKYLRLARLSSDEDDERVMLYSCKDSLRTIITTTSAEPPQMVCPTQAVQDGCRSEGFNAIRSLQTPVSTDNNLVQRAENGSITLSSYKIPDPEEINYSGGNRYAIDWDPDLHKLAEATDEQVVHRRPLIYNFRYHYEEIFDAAITDAVESTQDESSEYMFDPSKQLRRPPPVRTLGDTPQRIGNFADEADPPHINYSHFLPMRIDPANPDRIDVENTASRLLLSEWTVGADPFSIAFDDPSDLRANAAANAEDLFTSEASKAVKAGQKLESLPSAFAPRQAPQPVASTGRTESQVFSAASQPTRRYAQSQSAPQVASDGVDQTFSQVLPGPFGGRPAGQTKPKKKKKTAGF